MKNLRKLLPYIREEYGRLALITLAGLVIAAISAVQPQLFKNILNELIRTSSQPGVPHSYLPMFLQLLILSIISVISSHIFNVASDTVMFNIRFLIRGKVFRQITGLSLDYFETHQPGAIREKAYSSVESFSNWINNLTYNFLGPFFTLLFVTFVLYRQSLVLGSIALGVIIVTYIEFDFTRRKTRPINKKWNQEGEKSGAIFNETISNMGTVATTSGIEQFWTKYAFHQSKTLGFALRVRRFWNYALFRRSIYNEISYILAIGVIVWMAASGKATPGDLLALTAYFSMIRSNSASFARFIPLTSEADVDAERLLEMLNTEPTIKDSPEAIPLRRLESIQFKNVSFTYPDGKKGAISNINFTISQASAVALVGPSGVGKSTITKLLLRYYDPTEGQILINHLPVEHYTISSIRQKIGVVMQDVALFNTTVKENLKLARPKSQMADIMSAAQQAHADEFIEELPKQYNTIVGERGVKLSGGQKQRVAIARAILKDPDLIILDEATSALDSESERLVQSGLNKLRRGRMSLTIAHRLSTVQHADEILVLKKGTISERGTHIELMKKQRGLYRKLFNLQSASGEVQL